MTDQPKILHHFGDLVEFECICGEEHHLVWNGGNTDPCEGCGRVWAMKSEVVMVKGPNEGTSS